MTELSIWIDALPGRAFAAVMVLGLLFAATVFTLLIGRLFRYMPDYRMPLDVADEQRKVARNGFKSRIGAK